MIETETDAAKNLVTIRYRGVVTAEETTALLERIQLAIDSMQPGFGLLVDFTPLTSMEPGCAPSIRATMDHANTRRVAVVIRVIPDPRHDLGMEIMSRFHYSREVQTFTCETMAEAMRLLFD